MNTIINTTVISNFASIGQIDLLRQLFGNLSISLEVYEEVEIGLAEGYEFYKGVREIIKPFAESGWVELVTLNGELELRLFADSPAKLHKGEASSIAIAKSRDWLFLSDDAAARNYAASLNVPVPGTLGCLALSAERNLVSLEQANEWLQRLIENGYYSPVTDLGDLL